jgi:hypothetical protein
MSHMPLGALKLVAQKIDVRGNVSNPGPFLVDETTKYSDEAPRLTLRLLEEGNSRMQRSQLPHQKLIVIDGLLAFKGSANLTLSGWRQAAIGRDVIEVETHVRQVQELHDRFFCLVWRETNPPEPRRGTDGGPCWL